MSRKIMLTLLLLTICGVWAMASTAEAVKPQPAVCGNGACESSEDCLSCPEDCLECPPTVCNNDGVCNAGEDCVGCPADCAKFKIGRTWYCCGDNGFCGDARCGADCGSDVPVCGNNLPEYGEECDDGNTVPGDGCDANCVIEQMGSSVPTNQYNVGDSIGEGEAAYGSNILCIPTNIRDQNHDIVWSTGWQLSSVDTEKALNQRFEAMDAAAYLQNDSTHDAQFNRAISGNTMSDFPRQAQEIVDEATIRQQPVGMISILLGNNDVCGNSASVSSGMTLAQIEAAVLASMTSLSNFEADYRAGLDILAGSEFTRDAVIHVSSIPAIYYLWLAKHSGACATLLYGLGAIPCQNLLDSPTSEDCYVTGISDPNTVDEGDGLNCKRRKMFHKAIRDEFNTRLEGILMVEYAAALPNGHYADLFGIRFESRHVNNGDFFHPSLQGHKKMACEEWNASAFVDVPLDCSGI